MNIVYTEEQYIDQNNRYPELIHNQMALVDQEQNQLAPANSRQVAAGSGTVGSKTSGFSSSFFGKPTNMNTINSTNTTTSKNLAMYQNQSSKQSKTRNNLQQHVISQNPNGKVKQAVVGEPYMAFRNQAQATIASKTQRKAESVEWQKSAYAKKSQLATKQTKQVPTPLNNRSNQSSTEWLDQVNNHNSATSRKADNAGNSFNISIRDNNAQVTQSNGYQQNQRQLKQRGKMNNSELKCPALPSQDRTQ